MMGSRLQPVAVDLFCGAGGLSYGMMQAGIAISAGIDIDPACRYPFESNIKSPFHEKDLRTLSPGYVESLFPKDSFRVLAGCAPCQPFSPYTNGGPVREQGGQLLSKFGEVVNAVRPDLVAMENVPQLQKYPVFREFLEILNGAGYRYNYNVIRCSDYGVPQKRRRLVLLASRFGDIRLVSATHVRGETETVRNTIWHLDAIEAGGTSSSDPLHKSSRLSAKNLERIYNSKPGGTWHDWDEGLRAVCHTKETGQTYSSVYGRMQWDALAPTITTQFHVFGTGRFGHPDQDRAISLREGALLQTFPGEYSFIPKGEVVQITPVARLIGNAVPVKLGEAIGRSIMMHLKALPGNEGHYPQSQQVRQSSFFGALSLE